MKFKFHGTTAVDMMTFFFFYFYNHIVHSATVVVATAKKNAPQWNNKQLMTDIMVVMM